MKLLTSIEICAGAGGQSIGLEKAGFEHIALVEIEPLACETLKYNRPQWNVINADVRTFSATKYNDKVDLLAGGVPCPPFSVAGKQLGSDDERDLFPEMIRLTEECSPRAVMIENVKGILELKFKNYRKEIIKSFNRLGYRCDWRLLNASDFGVPQLRPRAILVCIKEEYFDFFEWPEKLRRVPDSVGEVLYPMMSSCGWLGVDNWRKQASSIAPTLVGGSKKHGGADLGPTRARQAWMKLGVDGKSLANEPPSSDFEGVPKLTVEMTAIIQGFPTEWKIMGRKTAAYRQIGNAFPAPVAEAMGLAISSALNKSSLSVPKSHISRNEKRTRVKSEVEGLLFA